MNHAQTCLANFLKCQVTVAQMRPALLALHETRDEAIPVVEAFLTSSSLKVSQDDHIRSLVKFLYVAGSFNICPIIENLTLQEKFQYDSELSKFAGMACDARLAPWAIKVLDIENESRIRASSFLEGLAYGKARGDLSQAQTQQLFDAAMTRWTPDEPEGDDTFPAGLEQLCPHAFDKMLVSEQYLHPDAAGVWCILQELSLKPIRPPLDRVLKIAVRLYEKARDQSLHEHERSVARDSLPIVADFLASWGYQPAREILDIMWQDKHFGFEKYHENWANQIDDAPGYNKALWTFDANALRPFIEKRMRRIFEQMESPGNHAGIARRIDRTVEITIKVAKETPAKPANPDEIWPLITKENLQRPPLTDPRDLQKAGKTQLLIDELLPEQALRNALYNFKPGDDRSALAQGDDGFIYPPHDPRS